MDKAAREKLENHYTTLYLGVAALVLTVAVVFSFVYGYWAGFSQFELQMAVLEAEKVSTIYLLILLFPFAAIHPINWPRDEK
jgi:hypothetical protein